MEEVENKKSSNLRRRGLAASGLLVVALLGSAFYWYEWRPQQIVKSCNKEASNEALKAETGKQEIYNLAFELCTRGKGLK